MDPIGTPEQLQQALDASIEANRRRAEELALADALARSVERLLFARRTGGDLIGPYAAMTDALKEWQAGRHQP